MVRLREDGGDEERFPGAIRPGFDRFKMLIYRSSPVCACAHVCVYVTYSGSG